MKRAIAGATVALFVAASNSYAQQSTSGAELQAFIDALSKPTTSTAVITANPYRGVPLSPYDSRVSPYSSKGALNPYTTGGGQVYGTDGTYLGRLNSNPYDAQSVSNSYGKYGSPYSSTSINNPYSTYGSPYSNKSARNPYATSPPIVVYPVVP